MSYPLRVRGLKYNLPPLNFKLVLSYPLRVRGLKFMVAPVSARHWCRTPWGYVDWNPQYLKLAPYLGRRTPWGYVDWNSIKFQFNNHIHVVPLEGTWIEIKLTTRLSRINSVVPLEGTWIEIGIGIQTPTASLSRTPWGYVDWNVQCPFHKADRTRRTPWGYVDWNFRYG